MKKSSFSWLLKQIRPRIPSLIALMTINMFSAWLGVIFAIALQRVIDSAVSGVMSAMIECCLVLAGIIVLRVLCSAAAVHLNQMIRANLDRDFKRNILHKILRSEYSEISRFHSGDLITRMNRDAQSAYNGVLVILSSMTSMVTSVVSAICVLMGMAPGFTVAMVIASIIIALFTLLIQRRMKQLHKDVSAASGKVSGFLHEAIEKLLVVQALDVSEEIEHRCDDVLEKRWQIQRRQKNLSLVMSMGTSVLSYAGSFVTLVWCAYKLLHGEISFGQLSSISALTSQLQTPLMTLPSAISSIIAISAACERIMEIEQIADQESCPDSQAAHALYQRMTGISFRHLTFAYDRAPVIRDLTLTIPKGGLTVIVGASGIGKSTLLKLMLSIYKPVSGELMLETEDGEIPISRAARKLFSYAPQGNLLLSGTLRENLLLTNPDADEEAIQQALYVSAMDEYVATLPEGLNTYLGENGAGLSEGQAQRLSLARAILSGAPVLLLDEVTSALDEMTERVVLERICALADKTCIAVTHRPAALALADHKIMVTEHDIRMENLR